MGSENRLQVKKITLAFAGICVVVLLWGVFSAFSSEPQEAAVVEAQSLDFDHNGKAVFESFDRISGDHREDTSTKRTLSEYYSRRQYPGSPPVIPHPLAAHGIDLACLACHASGGWTASLRGMTPVTPHPEHVGCLQCHVWPTTDELFREIDWKTVSPPRLGRTDLPGAPPPIPHDLQMRGNCIACHVGPATLVDIRVKHPLQGNCRQCHVEVTHGEPFQRKPQL